MHRTAAALLSLVLLSFALPAQAGGGTRDKIIQLIKMDGAVAVADAVIDRQRPLVRKNFLAQHPGIANKTADAYVDAFAAELTARRDEFIELIAVVYAETFTPAEIDDLLAFHASPLGQKFRAATPAIFLASSRAGTAWGKKHGADVAAAAMARLKALGYAIK